MKKYSMSWVIGAGLESQGGNLNNPSLDQIHQILSFIAKSSGSLTVNVIGDTQLESRVLQVQAANGLYVLMLGEEDADDYTTRTLANTSASNEQVEILGNLWSSKIVCSDLKLVTSVFEEFFSTGNVSHLILN